MFTKLFLQHALGKWHLKQSHSLRLSRGNWTQDAFLPKEPLEASLNLKLSEGNYWTNCNNFYLVPRIIKKETKYYLAN